MSKKTAGAENGSTRKTNKTKLRRRKRAIIALSCVLVVVIAIGAVFGETIVSLVQQRWHDVSFTDDPTVLSKHKTPETGEEIINIALFGIASAGDAMSDTDADRGLSDTIMIISINTTTNSVKMISVMRDCYVAVPGYRSKKINTAYSYGGAELAIKTLNTNFKLDIEDYVTVNISDVISIVDAVGGVDIALTNEERRLTIQYAAQVGHNEPLNETVPGSKIYHMDGMQAAQYSRIRKTADGKGDAGRVERQGKVITALKNKFLELDYMDMLALVPEVLKLVKTSLSYNEIISLLPVALSSKLTLEQKRIPTDLPKTVKYTSGGDPWAFRFADLNEVASYIRMYIYDASDLPDDIVSER